MLTTLDPNAFLIEEKSTGTYTATVVGNDQVTPLPAATLLTLTLFLYVIKADGTTGYIRGTVGNPQNVLNLNNVTVSTGGVIAWTIQTADTTLIEALDFERHIALFQWTWAGGAGKHEVVLVVKNLREI